MYPNFQGLGIFLIKCNPLIQNKTKQASKLSGLFFSSELNSALKIEFHRRIKSMCRKHYPATCFLARVVYNLKLYCRERIDIPEIGSVLFPVQRPLQRQGQVVKLQGSNKPGAFFYCPESMKCIIEGNYVHLSENHILRLQCFRIGYVCLSQKVISLFCPND